MGELIPAEERLQNVLKSITDRIAEEKTILDHLTRGGCSMEVYEQRASLIQGLDIAWSLAKTESLRTVDSPGTL